MQQTISFQVRACAVLCCAAFVGVTSASGQPVPQGYGNASLAYQDRLTPLERVMPKLNRAVSVRFADVSLEEALLEIGAGAGLDVSYSSEKARASRHRVTLALERVTALEALHKVLEGSGLKLMVAPGQQLILTRQTAPAGTPASAPSGRARGLRHRHLRRRGSASRRQRRREGDDHRHHHRRRRHVQPGGARAHRHARVLVCRVSGAGGTDRGAEHGRRGAGRRPGRPRRGRRDRLRRTLQAAGDERDLLYRRERDRGRPGGQPRQPHARARGGRAGAAEQRPARRRRLGPP